MQYLNKIIMVIALIMLFACVNQESLTPEEIKIQNRADAVVSNLLFENDLDEKASYNVHKDGFLVVKFADTVPSKQYTDIVNTLRSHPDINGVRAEQSGREVCPIR